MSYDDNAGLLYHGRIAPYSGVHGAGADKNAFWPVPSEYDWAQNGLLDYKAFFTLPNNERYYDVCRGNVHFFIIDSNALEPDGNSVTSAQAQWLKVKLALSTAPWKVVFLFDAPYSSTNAHATLRWPFGAWGANMVISSSSKNYERFDIGGVPFINNGLGGNGPVEAFAVPLAAPTNLAAAVLSGNTYESLEDVGLDHVSERHRVRVYSWKENDGDPDTRLFSPDYVELEINNVPFSQVNTNYDILWTWDAVPGADGYRVLIDEDQTGETDAIPAFTKGFDVTTNALNSGDAEPWDSGMVDVTPTDSGDDTIAENSVVRYNAKFGAGRIKATATSLSYEFINTDKVVIDSVTLTK